MNWFGHMSELGSGAGRQHLLDLLCWKKQAITCPRWTSNRLRVLKLGFWGEKARCPANFQVRNLIKIQQLPMIWAKHHRRTTSNHSKTCTKCWKTQECDHRWNSKKRRFARSIINPAGCFWMFLIFMSINDHLLWPVCYLTRNLVHQDLRMPPTYLFPCGCLFFSVDYVVKSVQMGFITFRCWRLLYKWNLFEVFEFFVFNCWLLY